MAKANSSFSEVQIARRIKEGRGVEIPGDPRVLRRPLSIADFGGAYSTTSLKSC